MTTKKPPVYTGYYNGLKYVILRNSRKVYEAGNSPLDSQGYVSEDEGVGIEQMKNFCKSTAQEMATENQGVVKSIRFKKEI